MRINQVITDVPFGDGTVQAYIDTSDGAATIELGEIDEPDATVTTDYATARAMFVDQDPASAMQAFMEGRVKVQGDMMKLMAMQTSMPANEFSQELAAEIQAITADFVAHVDDEDFELPTTGESGEPVHSIDEADGGPGDPDDATG